MNISGKSRARELAELFFDKITELPIGTPEQANQSAIIAAEKILYMLRKSERNKRFVKQMQERKLR